MKYELKCVNIWSAVRILFVVFLVLGFLVGLFYGWVLIGLMGRLSETVVGEGLGEGLGALKGLGVLAVGLLSALMWSVGGTLLTAMGLWLYNLIAGWAGGVEVALGATQEPPTDSDRSGISQVAD